jgi:hypothetical protein
MRIAILVVTLLGMATGAWADPADLTGGVLIAHHEANIPWSVDPPPATWCGAYSAYAIGDLSEVVAQLPAPTACCWYILAAWEVEAKTWCGTEFGFGGSDPACFTYYRSEPCFPVAGLEIPTANWPGPNEGTTFVTTGDPWIGNWIPVYFFGGYAYDSTYGSTVIQIAVDPPTGFCGFSNCLNPPASFSVAAPQRGGMGINMAGVVPIWPVVEPWACCVPHDPWCVMAFEQECAGLGGTWHEGETCDTYVCPQMWACCIGGICQILMEENCVLVGGEFLGAGTSCEPNPCPAVCCFNTQYSPMPCMILLEADCAAQQGDWHPEWTSCEPNPCEIYSPSNETSWGRIKSMYR